MDQYSTETARPSLPPTDPTFSIVVQALNAAATIAESIESVLGQSLEAWELIIVDDGSVDHTLDVALRYAERDSRIKALREASPGHLKARATGVAVSKAPWVLRLDADDLLLPDYLAEMERFMVQYPGRDIYACNALCFGPDGRTVPWHRGRRFRRVTSVTLDEMLEENLVFGMALFRRGLFSLAGADKGGVLCEDYSLWLNAMARGATHIYNPAVLCKYRIGPSQVTSIPTKALLSNEQILENMLTEPRLTERQRLIAQRHLHRVHARLDRVDFERRLRTGDYTGARIEYWRIRKAYRKRARYWTSWALMLPSPRLFWRVTGSRRDLRCPET